MRFNSNVVSLGRGEGFTASFNQAQNQTNIYKSMYGIIEQSVIKQGKRMDERKQLFYGDRCWEIGSGYLVLSENQFRLEK